MKKFSKIMAIALAMLMLCASFAACGLVEDSDAVESKKIQKEKVLTVDGDVDISGAYYGWYFSNAYNNAYAIAQQEAQADSSADSASAPAEVDIDIEAVKKEAINSIVATKMACKKADKEGITLSNLDRKNIDSQVEQYKQSMLSGFSQQGMSISFNDYLSAMNTNSNTLTEIFTDEYKASLYYTSFVKDEYVTAKHILVMFGDDTHTRDEALTIANEIKAQLDGGADFDKLMNEKSEDTDGSGKVNNPEGYTFKRDGSMVAPFEDAAFSLAEGEISSPVAVEGGDYPYSGFHILKRIPTSASGIASVLTETDEIKAEKENIAKDVKVEETKKIAYYDTVFKQ